MATKAAAKKKRGLSMKNEAERVRLERLIEINEGRLHDALNVKGEPLSDKQQAALREVMRQQQEKLDELLAQI